MIDAALAAALRGLVEGQRLGALGTLHGGEPYVSMVPFAAARDGAALLIHVSALAAHTSDMLADPRVSLLIVAAPDPGVAPQATARITLQADAAPIEADSGAPYEQARAAYLARFPDSEPMFGFGDFSLFAIRPRAIRFVGGFAQARSLAPATFAAAIAAAR